MTKFYDLLLSDLRSLKNGFSRLLGLILLFTLIGHLFIVEPYFGYKNEQQALYGELNAGTKELQKVEGQFKELKDANQRVKQSLRKIKSEIKTFPMHLRNNLPRIEEQISASPQPRQSRPLLQLPSDITTFEKGVHWFINKWFDETIQKLKNEVINPVMQLETEAQDATREKLQKLSQKAISDISEHTEKIDPDFWHSFHEKTEVAQNLNRVVERAFGPIYAEINTLTEQINTVLASHQGEQKLIQENITKITGMETELKNRLDSLQSPIGKIPVSLTDFIKLFPLLITIFMVMLSLHLSRSSRLYAFLQESRAKQEDETDNKAFAYAVDCWYLPPYQNILQPMILTASIAVITGVFVRLVFLMTASPELFYSLTGKEETLQLYLYIVSYCLETLVILACLWSIRKLAVS